MILLKETDFVECNLCWVGPINYVLLFKIWKYFDNACFILKIFRKQILWVLKIFRSFLTLTLGWKNEKPPSGPTELDLEAGNLVIEIRIFALKRSMNGFVTQ